MFDIKLAERPNWQTATYSSWKRKIKVRGHCVIHFKVYEQSPKACADRGQNALREGVDVGVVDSKATPPPGPTVSIYHTAGLGWSKPFNQNLGKAERENGKRGKLLWSRRSGSQCLAMRAHSRESRSGPCNMMETIAKRVVAQRVKSGYTGAEYQQITEAGSGGRMPWCRWVGGLSWQTSCFGHPNTNKMDVIVLTNHTSLTNMLFICFFPSFFHHLFFPFFILQLFARRPSVCM